VQVQDAASPARFVAVDATTGAVGETVLAVEDGTALPEGRPFQSVQLPDGGNGESVQAWVATPAVSLLTESSLDPHFIPT